MVLKLIKNLFVYLGICLSLFACTKEKDASIDNEGIVFGTKENMKVTVFDTVIASGYNKPKTFAMDINGDQIPDFRLTSDFILSLDYVYKPFASIKCLNSNVLIYGLLTTDTTFYYYQAQSYYQDTVPHIKIFSCTSYSCQRSYETDIPLKITPDTFKVAYKDKGEVLFKSEAFKSDSVILSESWDNNSIDPIIHGDTIYYNLVIHQYSCNAFPSNIIKYIGIKIKDTQGDKIGWIKLSLTDNYKITLLESAIQK